ncbi:GbsR/MarR family transcriptional regulator [Nonomuraea composti]|uniref:GbsR/MarR family transcriptional regulator n=1 Tax=Nonomuraea composti TaxID=2720023 RepID=UPI001981E2FE|nr:MarR family transcriptional regulator [Nonomuraea sp. FMUSA5-5]
MTIVAEFTTVQPAESEFVDRMGLVMERLGATRSMGRLWAWLMICDPPDPSLTDLAAELSLSKTAVSTVARQLEAGGIIERVPTAGREHRYRAVGGGWAQILRVQLELVKQSLETLEYGLSILDEGRAAQRVRLEETRDFFAFTVQDGDGMLQRWQEYRDRSS